MTSTSKSWSPIELALLTGLQEMARRGFFAELQHQSRVAAREQERREREAAREAAAFARHVEQAERAASRANAQMARAADTERRRLEKEARDAHLDAMEAEVERRNRELDQAYLDIDSLLASTLTRDDYVDLSSLKAVATTPPFDRADLEVPTPEPIPIPYPDKPVLELPEPPRGLASLFGKKKHAEAVEYAERNHESAIERWASQCRKVDALRQSQKEKHSQAEVTRLSTLAFELERFAKECAARETEVAEQNQRLSELIANLGYGTQEAIQEYVSIVLSNSVYPEHFPVAHEFEFDPSSAELRLRVQVLGPDELPCTKGFKYSKAADEITSSDLPQKQCRDRYTSAIHQVALRSFHEVFESDRRGLIRTISLEVGTNTTDPATGLRTCIPFVIAAADRNTFVAFDLSAVVPALTLARLGASVSKNPFGLVPAERSGVRRA